MPPPRSCRCLLAGSRGGHVFEKLAAERCQAAAEDKGGERRCRRFHPSSWGVDQRRACRGFKSRTQPLALQDTRADGSLDQAVMVVGAVGDTTALPVGTASIRGVT